MNTILHLLARAIAVMATAYILPGITLSNFWTAVVVAIVLGFLNIFIKPVILFLTLPINFLTLGLFTFVINAFIILLTSYVVPGFFVPGFISALVFSIVLALINLSLEFFV